MKRHEPADLPGVNAGIPWRGPDREAQSAEAADLSPTVTPVNLFHDQSSLPSVP
jgi:hypothetical protein